MDGVSVEVDPVDGVSVEVDPVDEVSVEVVQWSCPQWKWTQRM